MLKVNQLIGFGQGNLSGPVRAGLIWYLDAGNSASYSGSGSTWSNLVSAPADGQASSAYNFSKSGGTITFHGSAGGMSSAEYWTFDDINNFVISSATTFTNSLFQNGAKFTLEFWFRTPAVSSGRTWLELPNATSNRHFMFNYASPFSSPILFEIGGSVVSAQSANLLAANTIYQVVISLDENGGNVSFFALNGVYAPVSGPSNTFDGAYTSPSASSGNPPQIGTFETDARLYIARCYNIALSISQIAQNFNNDRARFGL